MTLKRGFTLVEMLVVIAILGILTAVAIPMLSSSFALAQKSNCVSNLRQIWVATNGYATEYNSYPLAYSTTLPDGTRVEGWKDSIIPYFGANTDLSNVFFCPSCSLPVADKQNAPSYGGNPRIMRDPRSRNAEPIRPVNIKYHSRVFLFADGAQRSATGGSDANLYREWGNSNDAFVNEPLSMGPDTDGTAGSRGHFRFRHDKKTMNVVMVDGSIHSFKNGEMLNANVVLD